MASGRRITKTRVDTLPANAVLWDAAVRGFGVRRQRRDPVYVLKYRSNGKQRVYTIGRHGAPWTVEKARTEAQRILGEVAKGTDPAVLRSKTKAAPTLETFARRYVDEFSRAHKKPRTVREERRLLDREIVPRLGTRRVADIDRGDIARFHAAMKDRPILANRALALLSHMLNYAVDRGERREGPNPCRKVKRYPEHGRERFLSEAELGALGAAITEAQTTGVLWHPDPEKKIKHAPREENRRVKIDTYSAAALRLLLLTGARLREILHLRWENVDFERGLLFLPDSKTGKKTIVLNAPALDVLNGLDRVSPYVIAGENLTKPRADLKRPWSLVRRHAGLEGLRIHDLRHTYASFGAGGGLGLPIIGKLLGHSQASTTQRYAHLHSDPLRKASEAIGGRIAAALDGKPPAAVVEFRKGAAANA